jgi:predicted phage terminase large subunit-like protein
MAKPNPELTPLEQKLLSEYLSGKSLTQSYLAVKPMSGEKPTSVSVAKTMGSRIMQRICKKKDPRSIEFSSSQTLALLASPANSTSGTAPRKRSSGKVRLSLSARTMVLACALLSFMPTCWASGRPVSISAPMTMVFGSTFPTMAAGIRIIPEIPMLEIRPQGGPQEAFLASRADIAIYGGAAGGGKTFGLLMEPLRHIRNQQFGSVYFRRTMPMITAEGGAWDTAHELYIPIGARFSSAPQLVAGFRSGSKISFHQLQYEDTIHDWQSAQIALELFDELTQFSKRQFFYMLSRNRSTSGVHGYVRCATNPDPDSWVRTFISWWIDDDTGLPIKVRSGVLRWFVRIDDVIEWADTPMELLAKFGPDCDPLSVTFIPSSVYDNKILLAKDPGYLSKLKALPRWEREQLLGGNWNARASAGMIFARTDFEIVDVAPEFTNSIRYWDRAATEVSEVSPDPDWTAGVRIGKSNDGLFYITDVSRFRERPLGVKTAIKNTATQDGPRTAIGIEQDPGQAGVAEAGDLVRSLAGFNVKAYPATQKKTVRWKPLSAQVQAGNVKLVRGKWNDAFIDELSALTDNPKEYGHDDQADSAAGGFNALTARRSWGVA